MNHELRLEDRSFLEAVLGDGVPLLVFTGLSLILCGAFALFLSITGHFLPHDVHYLGMTAADLCSIKQCRIVHFMFHDRVSFGGAIIAIGTLYLWLAMFPLRQGQAWAWWVFLISGLAGFGSFLAYLGYGYLDRWHGVATLSLLPCFVGGLVRSYRRLPKPVVLRTLFTPTVSVPWKSSAGIGRACLLFTGVGMISAGLTIMTVGMTSVFVPQDLNFLGLKPVDLNAINPRLVPLIAHDRAGFGGALCSCGLIFFFAVWRGTPSRSLWQALGTAGTVGFGTAIGVHPVIGYVDLVHLAPAIVGAVAFTTGLSLSFGPAFGRTNSGKF